MFGCWSCALIVVVADGMVMLGFLNVAIIFGWISFFVGDWGILSAAFLGACAKHSYLLKRKVENLDLEQNAEQEKVHLRQLGEHHRRNRTRSHPPESRTIYQIA